MAFLSGEAFRTDAPPKTRGVNDISYSEVYTFASGFTIVSQAKKPVISTMYKNVHKR
jgi:hypothetical protein